MTHLLGDRQLVWSSDVAKDCHMSFTEELFCRRHLLRILTCICHKSCSQEVYCCRPSLCMLHVLYEVLVMYYAWAYHLMFYYLQWV